MISFFFLLTILSVVLNLASFELAKTKGMDRSRVLQRIAKVLRWWREEWGFSFFRNSFPA